MIPELEDGEYFVSMTPESPAHTAFPAHIEVGARRRDWYPTFRPSVARAVAAWLGTAAAPLPADDGMVDGRLLIPGNRPDGWMFCPPPMSGSLQHREYAALADPRWRHQQPEEQLVTIPITRAEPTFPALLPSGWGVASPLFRRPVAEAVVAWTNTHYRRARDEGDPYGCQCGYWSGDVIVLIDNCHFDDPDYLPVIAEPEDGRWAIGAQDWVWEPTDPR